MLNRNGYPSTRNLDRPVRMPAINEKGIYTSHDSVDRQKFPRSNRSHICTGSFGNVTTWGIRASVINRSKAPGKHKNPKPKKQGGHNREFRQGEVTRLAINEVMKITKKLVPLVAGGKLRDDEIVVYLAGLDYLKAEMKQSDWLALAKKYHVIMDSAQGMKKICRYKKVKADLRRLAILAK